jgi:hypothetical protein
MSSFGSDSSEVVKESSLPLHTKKEKETFYVSFYTKSGGALRENLIMKATNQLDGRLLNAAQKKGKSLGAHFYHIFTVIPRRFAVDYEDSCDCCGEPKNENIF